MDETGWSWEELQNTPIYVVERRLEFIRAKHEAQADHQKENSPNG